MSSQAGQGPYLWCLSCLLYTSVLAGLADKFGWNLTLARVLAIILMVSTQFGIFLYLVLALLLPYKAVSYTHLNCTTINAIITTTSNSFCTLKI